MDNLRDDSQFSRTGIAAGASPASVYMQGVYQWMTAGLAVTGLLAWCIAASPQALAFVRQGPVLIGLIIAQLAIVVALSAAVHKMSAGTATLCFILYSLATGGLMGSIFAHYPVGSIANAFFCTAGTFGAMAVWGTVTKRDLTGLGSFCMMGLVGVLIAMIVNFFLRSSMMTFVISCVGVIVFTGLTAYDVQKLLRFGAGAPLHDREAMRRGTICGALDLYLDFINLFLMLLRFFGASSRD